MKYSDASTSATNTSQRTVGIGDYDVTDSGAHLKTFGLGSCLGVALFDERVGVAGLIHIKRPVMSDQDSTERATFADSGIRLLCSKMEERGTSRRNITAKLAGGADICGFTYTKSDDSGGIGTQNIEAAVDTLSELNISIVGKDVGGEEHRTVCLIGSTGELIVETGSDSRYSI